MGDFRVTLEATGGHGCNRTAKEGDQITGCGRMDCPDCVTAEYFAKMKKFCSTAKATFHHWPADMTDHVLSKDGVCVRCGAQDQPYADGKPSARMLKEPCRTYSAAQEVIDDYSERNVQYHGMIMAVGRRVKG